MFTVAIVINVTRIELLAGQKTGRFRLFRLKIGSTHWPWPSNHPRQSMIHTGEPKRKIVPIKTWSLVNEQYKADLTNVRFLPILFQYTIHSSPKKLNERIDGRNSIWKYFTAGVIVYAHNVKP